MSVQAILSGTPVWVWALLAFLISRGFKALKGGTAPLSKLAIVPAVFAAWGIVHMLREPAAGWHTGLAWIGGALIGIAAGAGIAQASGMSVDRVHRTVTLPGSIVPLVLMIVTFASKFWLGLELATTHAGVDSMYVVLDGLVSGVVAGIFAGRFLIYWLGFHPVASGTLLSERI
jgi:hypothetical protein